MWDGSRWEINFIDRGKYLVEVDVGPTGEVVAVWTGLQAASYFARGHFGGTFDDPLVWITFSILFLAPFVDPRRPLRSVHFDLLAMLAFGASYAYFKRGEIDVSIPLVYPVLAYLLVRMIMIGFRPSRARGALVPFVPVSALAVGLVLVTAARVTLNLTSDKVIDVGYASVVGADRVAHGEQLYVANDIHGDTYGPLNYVAYIPFEALLPWKGVWDNVPAAHAASILFDLLTILGLFVLGTRLRAGPAGRHLGLALAWGWAACPFTLFGVIQNTNDGLVALLFVGSLLVLRAPSTRGVVTGLAAAAKFFPAALLPLYARADAAGSQRRVKTAAAFVVVVALAFAPFVPPGGLREVWDCTLGYQLGRAPDFSFWALHKGLGWSQSLLEIGAAALIAVVAFRPRGGLSVTQVSALAGAVVIALQIPASHWFYLYIAWFAPFVLLAFLGRFDSILAGSNARKPVAAYAHARPANAPHG